MPNSSSATARWELRRAGSQDDANHFRGQAGTLLLQSGLGRSPLLLNGSARLLHLSLGPTAGLRGRGRPCLHGLLPASFLILENGETSFAQALLVFGGARLGRTDVGARLLDRSFGFASALLKYSRERRMDDHLVGRIEQRHEDDRRNRSEQ